VLTGKRIDGFGKDDVVINSDGVELHNQLLATLVVPLLAVIADGPQLGCGIVKLANGLLLIVILRIVS
jgi:hypothetical protein